MTNKNVDLHAQRLVLTPLPGPTGPSTDAWGQDILARLLHVMGFEDVSFLPEPPDVVANAKNKRRLWHDRGSPLSAGKPGVLKCYDDRVEDWVPLTPDRARYIRGENYQHTAGAVPHVAPTPRDTWTNSENGHTYMFLEVAPGAFAWFDLS